MITIIGAGPAGLRTAELLAKQGKDVTVLEEHSEIGRPVQCTGIVTQSIKESIPLKKGFVVNRLNQVVVHAPDRHTADIKIRDIVIDRQRFDQHLAERAERAGARIILGNRVEGIAHRKKITLKVKDKKNKKSVQHKTDVLIGADGPNSIVSKHIGNKNPEFWIGKQARVRMPVEKNSYQVHFGKNFPGFFGWVVPESGSIARVGVAATRNVDAVFKRFMRHVGRHKVIEVQGGLIPKYDPSRIVEQDGAYLVGDAATQVKATTGGGLVPGLKAAECLANAINNESNYYVELAAVSRELKTNLLIRKMMDRFKDCDYNRLVRLLDGSGVKRTLSRHDRDHATRTLLSALVREPRLLIFAKVLFAPEQA